MVSGCTVDFITPGVNDRLTVDVVDEGHQAVLELRRLGLADRLAAWLKDRLVPEKVVHRVAEIIRFRMLMIAAGYEDANHADTLRRNPMFKLALDRPRMRSCARSRRSHGWRIF